MTTAIADHDDLGLRELGAALRSLRAPEAMVARAVDEMGNGRARHRAPVGPARLAVGALAAVLAVGLAVPPSRAAITRAFDDLFAGGDPPGTPIAGSEFPRWISDQGVGRAFVVADAGDGPRGRLIAFRDRDGAICFDYGGSVEECDSPQGWKGELAAQPMLLRGPSGARQGSRFEGHPYLFGFTNGSIASVRVRYWIGPDETASARNGGFAVKVDPGRGPTEIVALDARGEDVTTASIADRF
jgi:hypothetical protein